MLGVSSIEIPGESISDVDDMKYPGDDTVMACGGSDE